MFRPISGYSRACTVVLTSVVLAASATSLVGDAHGGKKRAKQKRAKQKRQRQSAPTPLTWQEISSLQKSQCQESKAACDAAKDAHRAAKGCVEWVRRGTYKSDGTLKRYEDCTPKPEQLKPTMDAACGQHYTCTHKVKCDATIANVAMEKPACVYTSPGTFRCSGGEKCPEILIGGIRFPDDPAAASDLSLRCTQFSGISSGITQIKLEREGVHFVNPEEERCPEEPASCKPLQERFQKCLKTMDTAIDAEMKACECQVSYDSARRKPKPKSTPWGTPAVRECHRVAPKPRDASARATSALVRSITGADKLACKLWTPTDAASTP